MGRVLVLHARASLITIKSPAGTRRVLARPRASHPGGTMSRSTSMPRTTSPTLPLEPKACATGQSRADAERLIAIAPSSFLICGASSSCWPQLWMLMTSLKTDREIFLQPWNSPGSAAVGKLRAGLERSPDRRFLHHSVLVTWARSRSRLVVSMLATPSPGSSFRPQDHPVPLPHRPHVLWSPRLVPCSSSARPELLITLHGLVIIYGPIRSLRRSSSSPASSARSRPSWAKRRSSMGIALSRLL